MHETVKTHCWPRSGSSVEIEDDPVVALGSEQFAGWCRICWVGPYAGVAEPASVALLSSGARETVPSISLIQEPAQIACQKPALNYAVFSSQC